MTPLTTNLARLGAAGLLAILAMPAFAALPLGLQSPIPLPVPVPSLGNVTVATPVGPVYANTDSGDIGADIAVPPLPVPLDASASAHAHAGFDGASADATATAAPMAGTNSSAHADPTGVFARIAAWFVSIF